MAIEYKDLNPVTATFTLNEKEYELRPFDLVAQVWAMDEFKTKEEPNGIVVLSDLVQEMTNFNAVYKCTWHLLKRKRDFGFFDNFLKAIENDNRGANPVTQDIYKAFVKTLGVSQPHIDEFTEELELKKHSAAQS